MNKRLPTAFLQRTLGTITFLLAAILLSVATNAQIVGKTILNIDYESNTTNSGNSGVIPTNATATDAAYMVSPGAAGNYAIAHKIVYGDNQYYSDGNWRSESDAQDIIAARYYPGQERRYEFSVLLKDWTLWNTGEAPVETNLFQLKMSGGENVPLMIRTTRNAIRIRYEDVSVKDILANVQPYINKWIQFRIDVLWADATTGYMRTYMKLPDQAEYILVDEKLNYKTFTGNPTLGNFGYIKWGLYVTPQNVTRIAYHDDIRIITLGEPSQTTGLIWGNGISDANPAYLDGPYTKAPNIGAAVYYNNTSHVYLDPNLVYRASQNIVYFNNANPTSNATDNVVGTPYSDFSRSTLAATGLSGTTPGPAGRYLVKGWALGTTDTPSAFNPDQYYEFKLEPQSGYAISFSKIIFTSRLNVATGPANFVMRSSRDNFATDISPAGATKGATTPTPYEYDLSKLTNVTEPITLRLYFYGTTAISGTFSVGIEDFQFMGIVKNTMVLPVSFDNVEAFKNSSNIFVKWTTLQEYNNDYFEIQASTDGVNFKTIQTIQSNNGNATIPQQYEATIPLSSVLAGAPLLLLSLIGFAKKRKSKAIIIAGVCIVVVAFVSCKKNIGDAIDANDRIMIRIKQVDKDGNFKYSKVVTAIPGEGK